MRKIKDPKGQVIWEKASLTFVSDILKGSLAKPIQMAIREQTRVSVKIRIKKSDGTVDEGENVPDLHDDQLKVDPSEEAATRADAKEIAKRFVDMQPDIATGLKGGAAAKVKALVVSYSNNVKQQKFDDAGDDLDTIESLLAGAEEADDDDDAAAASPAAGSGARNEQLRRAIPNLGK
ncbi:MAG: hypothetical protein ABI330_07735 [Caldimonas sp.]|nr:hypothetical protein [Pseudomonadota bacterium]